MSTLRRAASVTLMLGAVVSLGLLLNSARNSPAILIFLYTGWVLLPFVGSGIGARRLHQQGAEAAQLMDISSLVMTGLALVGYLGAPLLPKPPRPAAVFLIVPLVCHIVTAMAYTVAAMRPRKSTSAANPPNPTP